MTTQLPVTTYGKYVLGVIFKIISLTGFCLISLGFEGLKTQPINSLAQFGIVCVIGTFLLLPIVLIFYRKELMQVRLKLYLLRAVLSIVGMVTWIEALKHFGSDPTVLVSYLTPIVIILIASLTKDEKLRSLSIVSGCICYGVIFFTLRTHVDLASYGFMIASLSAVSWGLYEVICKRQAVSEHFIVQAFFTFLFAGIMLFPFSYTHLVSLPAGDFLPYAGIATVRIVGLMFLFLSIKLATLNWLTPVTYLKFPIISLLGILILGRYPEVHFWIAAGLLIAINIVMMALVGRQRGKFFSASA